MDISPGQILNYVTLPAYYQLNLRLLFCGVPAWLLSTWGTIERFNFWFQIFSFQPCSCNLVGNSFCLHLGCLWNCFLSFFKIFTSELSDPLLVILANLLQLIFVIITLSLFCSVQYQLDREID